MADGKNGQRPVWRIERDGTRKLFASVSEAAKDRGFPSQVTLVSRAARKGYKWKGGKYEYDGTVSVPALPKLPRIPRVLVLDIETAPMLVTSWSLFEPRISHEDIVRDWYMLAWAAKWLFAPEVLSGVLTPEQAVAGDDAELAGRIWKLLDEADVVVAHNGNRFDLRKLNSKFLEHGFPPPSPYKSVDTLQGHRAVFGHSSNRLDYIHRRLGGDGKYSTSKGLWRRCMAGDGEALAEMSKYNAEDVLILEDVYVETRGWLPRHPNLLLWSGELEEGDSRCPVCLEETLEDRGFYATSVSVFDAVSCSNCGARSRRRKRSSGGVGLVSL